MQCAIWNTGTLETSKITEADRFAYDSPRAGGRYEITGSAKASLNFADDRQKAFLTSWLIDQHNAGVEWPLVTSEELERAKVAQGKKIVERRDRLLQVISLHTPSLGQAMRYEQPVFIVNDRPHENPYWAAQDILLAATESCNFSEVDSLITFAAKQALVTHDGYALSLTFDGHSHLEQLGAAPRVSNQAFVAMWFGAEVNDAYEFGISPAIITAGYRPMRIDQKEHNNKIDDEIIAEIRRSKFVVADFTCGEAGVGNAVVSIPRGGVYYEAGFAQGLGIPVIWTCRQDHIDKVHFDTRQFNHITWANPEELKAKLRNRIGAVIGDAAIGAG
ncbi:hypothetical protein [Mesorhizobium sp. 128a]